VPLRPRSSAPPRSKTPERLEGILDRAGEDRFAKIRPPIRLAVWREAVGARIAERATPVLLASGVLALRVQSSVWAHELSLLSDEVCTRLRDRGVEVCELRFRVGPVLPPDRPPERRIARSVPAARPLPPDLTARLAGVRDDALRATIAKAATSNLAWQQAVAPPADGLNEARRAARAPRSVGGETARPDRTTPAWREDSPGTRASGPDRSR